MSPRLAIPAALAISLLPSLPALALTPAETAGEYTAVVDNGSFETSGYFRLVISKSGRGSVAVRLGDEPVCVIGIGFDGGGIFVRPGGDPDMLARLIFVVGPDGNPVVTGEVEDDGHIYEVEAPKAAPTAGPVTGRHTFMVGSTPGIGNTGSGVARVGAAGRVTGAVRVKSGRPVTFGGRLTAAQELPIAARSLRTESSLVGNIEFGNPATTGTVSLHDSTGDLPLMIGGTTYNPRQPALTGATPAFSLDVMLNGVPSGTALWTRIGTITAGRLEGNPLRISVNRTTGAVSGKSGTRILRGVVLQNLNSLGGLVDGATKFEVHPSSQPGGFQAGVVKIGAGRLVVNGGNAFQGVANVVPIPALPIVADPLPGGQLAVNGQFGNAAVETVVDQASGLGSGVATSANDGSISGGGSVLWDSAPNSGVLVMGGTLFFGSGSLLNVNTSPAVLNLNGGSIAISGLAINSTGIPLTISNDLSIWNAGTLTIGSNGEYYFISNPGTTEAADTLETPESAGSAPYSETNI